MTNEIKVTRGFSEKRPSEAEQDSDENNSEESEEPKTLNYYILPILFSIDRVITGFTFYRAMLAQSAVMRQ